MVRGAVITVGNFDGLHIGHRALLLEARRAAEARSVPVVAMAFAEHPMTRLRPQHAPPMLCDTAQREELLRGAGADRVEWLTPDEKFLAQSPDEFVARVVGEFAPVAWVEGPDFRFGKARAGDVGLLRTLGERHGFEVRIVEPVETILADKSRCTVSSSLVRWLIAHGRVMDAAYCLGRPFAVRGTVVRGERLGRGLGFPTVNLDCGGRLLPGDGVYAGTALVDGRSHLAAISVGTKPALGGRSRAFEAHLIAFDGDLYGRTIDVEVRRWLRDQCSFPALDLLVAQIHRDVARVKEAA